MPKHYTCACGWEATAKTQEALLEKIKQHAIEKHPTIPYDEASVIQFIQDITKK